MQECSSLRSIHCFRSPFKWYEKDNNGYLKPFGFEYLKNDFTVVNKQELKDVWVPNGYVDIIKSDNIIKNNNLFGKNNTFSNKFYYWSRQSTRVRLFKFYD